MLLALTLAAWAARGPLLAGGAAPAAAWAAAVHPPPHPPPLAASRRRRHSLAVLACHPHAEFLEANRLRSVLVELSEEHDQLLFGLGRRRLRLNRRKPRQKLTCATRHNVSDSVPQTTHKFSGRLLGLLL